MNAVYEHGMIGKAAPPHLVGRGRGRHALESKGLKTGPRGACVVCNECWSAGDSRQRGTVGVRVKLCRYGGGEGRCLLSAPPKACIACALVHAGALPLLPPLPWGVGAHIPCAHLCGGAHMVDRRRARKALQRGELHRSGGSRGRVGHVVLWRWACRGLQRRCRRCGGYRCGRGTYVVLQQRACGLRWRPRGRCRCRSHSREGVVCVCESAWVADGAQHAAQCGGGVLCLVHYLCSGQPDERRQHGVGGNGLDCAPVVGGDAHGDSRHVLARCWIAARHAVQRAATERRVHREREFEVASPHMYVLRICMYAQLSAA